MTLSNFQYNLSDIQIVSHIVIVFGPEPTPWRNGSASDSRSEGCVFESRRGQPTFLFSKKSNSLEKTNVCLQ